MTLNIIKMERKDLKRVFVYKKTELDDPNTNFNVNEVLEFYTGQYPELTTASVQGPEVKEDKIIYQFKNNVGTKG